MNTNNLNTALYEKMATEQEKYRDWLKSQPPEEILHHTYEYTVREDIVMAMEELELTDAQAQALLESPSPLADVYRYFEKLETGYMDMIRDSIENRADDVCRAKEELRTTPIYPHSAAYAREHGELEQYRASNNVNLQCKESIEAAALDEQGTLLGTLQVHADDPRTSAYGVLGRFLDQQGASFDDVEKIVLTGLGSTYFHENIFGIPTIHALELDAIGRGGLYLSGLDEALVVSLGTGSAFIRASKTNGFRHLGGSGVGGGTLAGMAERFLGVTDIFALSEMALRGNKAMADLRIADVQEEDVPGLAADLTAANFGRIKSGASDADLAAALFNMIYENVGVMASLALSQDTTRNVVLTGSLASLAPAAKTFDIFNQMHDVFGIDYIIPPHPSFATAVGALLCDPLPEK